MIEQVTIEGYKSHVKTELELGRLTLLAGANGVGKTSALEAIDACLRCAAEQHDGRPLSPGFDERQLSRVAGVPLALSVGATKGDIPWSFSLRQRPGDGLELMTEWEFGTRKSAEDARPPSGLLVFLGASSFLALEPRQLARPRYCEVTSAELGRDGLGLANLVAEVIFRADGVFEQLLLDLTALFPLLKSVRVKRAELWQEATARALAPGDDRVSYEVEVRRLVGEELELDFLGAPGVAAADAPEGVLTCLGVLASVYSTQKASVILVDGLERSLHPRVQVELVKILRRLLGKRPQLQIVATTNSPQLLDAVDPKAIWVLASRDDGSTACRKLWDHPKAERSLEVQTPGEFFSAHDDRWVVERERGQ